MKSFVFACVTGLALLATPLVATAQDAPVAVVEQGLPMEYYGGAFVWLYGQQSTGTDIKFRWTSTALTNPFWYWDKEEETYKKYADSAVVNGKQVLAYFPADDTTTTVTLTVTDRLDSDLKSSDSQDVSIPSGLHDSSLWLVVTYRPWAQGLGNLAYDVANLAAPLPNSNEHFKMAKEAAKTAKDFEIFCQIMRFDWMSDPYDQHYNQVVTQYYLASRQVQFEQHETAAFRVRLGLLSGKWNKGVKDHANATIDAAVAAAEGGRLDFGKGTEFVAPASE